MIASLAIKRLVSLPTEVPTSNLLLVAFISSCLYSFIFIHLKLVLSGKVAATCRRAMRRASIWGLLCFCFGLIQRRVRRALCAPIMITVMLLIGIHELLLDLRACMNKNASAPP